jgi:mitochondrial fission protein ELM1
MDRLPRDLLVLTLACAGFAAIAWVLSRAIGAPFVLPQGESPAIEMHFSWPIVAALGGYAAFRARRARDVVTDLVLAALFIGVLYLNFHVKMWIPFLNPRSYDAVFFAVDDRLRPLIEGLRVVRHTVASVLPAADHWYMLAFFFLFALTFWFHAAGRRTWHVHNLVALTLAELLGALFYLVAPAVGPFLFEPGDNPVATAAQLRMHADYTALQAAGVTWLEQHGGAYFTAPLAAMPSLHFAGAFVLAWYAVRARLVVAPLAVALLGWIGIESIVTRWHYLVDLPAGLGVALLSIGLANRICRHRVETEALAREPVVMPPRVWAVLCDRVGDDMQILALARALGGPVEVKRLAFRRLGRLLDVWRGTNLLGISKRRSSPLEAPWPDLVISASMRNEPVCRWIREQSGGRTRYVHLGKPWARLATFDLVITVPEYRWLPQRANVHRNACSLHEISEARLAEAARIWAPALAHLPRPWIAVLAGGYAGPYVFDREKAERLGREASALARERGGSLLVTTSGRTSRAAVDGLAAAIDVPCSWFEWSRDAVRNPYLGFLALADAIIVTCDSTSMQAEACATRKPVYLFDLRIDGATRSPWRRCNAQRLLAFAYRNTIFRFAPGNMARDIAAVHDGLRAAGRAVWLGEPFPDRKPPPLDEMPRALERVRKLLATTS